MYTLGIETTCDETGIAIVKNGKEIICNLVASQDHIHHVYGGVFPELASRCHSQTILPLIQKALQQNALSQHDIDLIAVANSPGLIGSLLMGVIAAQTLAFAWNKPLIGVNHVFAHLYASMMHPQAELKFPALGVVLSGGHTFLAKIVSTTRYELISTTVDDAIGEAFDKVASLLGLPYPGGPHIEALSQYGNPNAYPFKAGQLKKHPLHFSFSGLKTQVLYAVQGKSLSQQEKQDLAASFQYAACIDIVKKTLQATQTFDCQGIYFGGGVTASRTLRNLFKTQHYPMFWPADGLSLDNAAMIAGLGFELSQKTSQNDTFSLSVSPKINVQAMIREAT